jgi:MFS family permease
MWSPLRHRRYRALWLANSASNLGNAMQAYAVLWLIASSAQGALTSALVQTVSTAPMLVLALLAGVLAQRIERAQLQFSINLAMALAAAGMALWALHGVPSPATLLLLALGVGSGAALLWPAWQASVATLLPADQLPAAASLNNLSFNLAALLGPPLGGVLLQWSGPMPLFAGNALSFLGLLVLYRHWSKNGALRPAVAVHHRWSWRSAHHALRKQPHFASLLVLTACAFFATVAFAALLPAYAQAYSQQDAGTFGSLLSALGLGALLSAFVLPTMRARFNPSCLLGMALACFAAMLTLLPLATAHCARLLIVMGGAAWATLITTLNSLVQTRADHHLRVPALTAYMLVLACGQTLGSLVWGFTGDQWGVAVAWRIAAGMLLLGAVYTTAIARRL